MAYAETRDGKLTGLWVGEVDRPGAGLVRQTFSTRKKAENYEAFVRSIKPAQMKRLLAMRLPARKT
ncbi:hypothetical protein ABIF63_001516 [Bradyrhizobium japonicum]|uniref:Uncharacterized protein n=1 Tax=Bradyrhizobium japonicum TaxID=375 RepID=A0ABV2RKE9_BRAJP|nr:hypothetical protein [Bradyrhizobium japonicum]UQD99045.1 hypothetical protein JEY30_01760 [Bradyrhizobium japonicum]